MKTGCRVIFCFLTLMVAGTSPPAVPALPAAEQGVAEKKAAFPLTAGKHQDVLPTPSREDPAAIQKLRLNIQDFVRWMRDHNEQILYQASEVAISRLSIRGAKSIFEPVLIGSLQYQDEARRNTLQEMVSQGFAGEFWERSNSYQAAVEGLVPTGGKLRFGYTLRDFKNSVDAKYGLENEAQTVVGLTITQPLLKGAGVAVTKAGIDVAEADAEIAFQTYRGQMMKVMAEAISSYWDLSLAQERYRVRRESEQRAEVVLNDSLLRFKTGRVAETDVLEARAGLALRRSLVSEARQSVAAGMNSVRTFLSSSAGEEKIDIDPTEPLFLKELNSDYPASLARTLRFRAEYLASRKKTEREDIRLVYAENQTWPQLDLKGSYNKNGLSETPRTSWNESVNGRYDSWFVGVELRVPLGGDRKGRSELEATRERKRQALLEFKAIELSLANAVDTAIKSVANAREQALQLADMTEINRRLLAAEVARFNAGKSNSRDLLQREEELSKAREAEIESLVKYNKALMQLDFAEGTLLATYGVDTMEADS